MNFRSMTQLFVKPRPEQHQVAFDAQQQVTWPALLSDLSILTAKLLKTEHQKNRTICWTDNDLFTCERICSSYIKRKYL